jgi:N-sulfoglucosamine sulfohydrolase
MGDVILHTMSSSGTGPVLSLLLHGRSPRAGRIASWLVVALGVVIGDVAAAGSPGSTVARPNILWLSAEDISPDRLGCYGGRSHTPRIDALAAAGIRFDRAFAVAPVCAPSRSGIITGMAPTSLGSLPMRCRATPPPFVVGFPRLLQDAGYWCSNNAKTDYNLVATRFDPGWNESGNAAHWRNRPDPTQPFFAVFNFTICHESGLFDTTRASFARVPPAGQVDPASVRVPPYYPDTPAVRADLARRLELAALVDLDVGRVLDQLAADGLADDTIVVFWGDHGEGIPRGKRSLTELGLGVPLVVRVPAAFASLATLVPGTIQSFPATTPLLVSLLDLGPTMLDLAGVPAPAWMEGRSFLGPHAVPATERRHVVGMRDRMDELEGHGRSLVDARHRYVRNVAPWVPGDDLPDYATGVAITRELRAGAAAGTLPPAADWFTRPWRLAEELYDLERDPDEIMNIAAGTPAEEVAATVSRLRADLRAWMRDTRDTGVLPEAMLRREAAVAGSEWAVFHPGGLGGVDDPAADAAAAARHAALLEVMLAAGEPGAVDRFTAAATAVDPAGRFWAACGAGWSGLRVAGAAGEAAAMLTPLADDTDTVVAATAGRWLVQLATIDPAGGWTAARAEDARRVGLAALARGLGSHDSDERHAVMAAIAAVGGLAADLREQVEAVRIPRQDRYPAALQARFLRGL